MTPTCANEGELPSGESGDAYLAKVVAKRRREQLQAPFAPNIQSRLQSLDSHTREDVIRCMRTVGRGPGTLQPTHWSDATRLILVNAVVDATRVCSEAAGISVAGIQALTTQTAVNTLLREMSFSWSAQRTTMVLVELQKALRILEGQAAEHLAESIKLVARLPRRDIDDRVFAPKYYRDAAIAMFRLAEMLEAGGKHDRARTLGRDAAQFALASVAHLRLSEYHRLNVGHLNLRTHIDGTESLTVLTRMTKTYTDRIPIISDPLLKKIILAVAVGPQQTPLFRNRRGGRLSKEVIWQRFVVGGELAVGKRASANVLRRSRSLGGGTDETKSTDLGQENPRVFRRYYRTNEAQAGAQAVREANAAARRAIAERKASVSVT